MEVLRSPLTEEVSFQAVLEKGNRVQIPKLILWKFKMERDEVFKVGVSIDSPFSGWQFFYAKMDKQGRILIPQVTLASLAQEDNPNLAGRIFEVSIHPT